MGTSHTPEALAAKLLACATAFAALDKTVVEQGALVTKRTVLAGAPARLRGVGKRGARLNVRYTVSAAATGGPAALVFATGPWPLIERDTEAHPIPRQTARRRKTRYAVVPGGAEGGTHGRGGVRARVQHPGTHGKRPWAKGVDRATPIVARMFQVQGEAVLRAVF